jgi:hypothetical protein
MVMRQPPRALIQGRDLACADQGHPLNAAVQDINKYSDSQTPEKEQQMLIDASSPMRVRNYRVRGSTRKKQEGVEGI